MIPAGANGHTAAAACLRGGDAQLELLARKRLTPKFGE